MKKFCVFCGNKPANKNKEHVIPKWLIKLTGDENRKINIGLNFNKLIEDTSDEHITENFKNRMFSFSHFQFPACTECNTKYSELEGKTKAIIEKILIDEYVSSDEVNILLDWFDKVRIGLWLGSITLDKISDLVNPNFHIDQRIGIRDRALYIYKLPKENNITGINFHGFNTPGFQYAPCVFGLRINNYFFINYSKEDLLSKNLGFPYAELVNYAENGKHQEVEIKLGLNKVTKPIIIENFPRPTLSFYQAIFNDDIYKNTEFSKYSNDLKSIKHTNRSLLFYYDSFDKKIKNLKDDDEILIEGNIINSSSYLFNFKVNECIIDELEKLLKFKHHLNLSDKEKSKNIEENRKDTLAFHKMVKKIIKELSKVELNKTTANMGFAKERVKR